MQYFKPEGDFFVGDCLPFFHEGTFHFVYLLDENHHQGMGGMGGHQWAHASSTDLIHWVHHPLAIGIDEPWECSICTGSVFFHDGVFYAFYATRKNGWSEHLSLATGTDGITFTKTQPNPFASPPPGYGGHFRDPFVFQDAGGTFHMLVTAQRPQEPLPQMRGCLAHLSSPDLKTWTTNEPFLSPGFSDVPECPDLFEWNGWYYLIFSNHAVARYRLARSPFGPWLKAPVDTFDSSNSRVLKSAAFSGNRRLGAAFLPARKDDLDDGELLYAGNAIFRELVQFEDGTLGSKFPPEMIPASDELCPLAFRTFAPGAQAQENNLHIEAPEEFGAAMSGAAPRDFHLSLQIAAKPHAGVFGLRLRASEGFEGGCELRFFPQEGRVELGDQSIASVSGLDEPFRLDVVVKDNIFDVCIGERRCLIQRAPQASGEQLFFFCRNGEVAFQNIELRALLKS